MSGLILIYQLKQARATCPDGRNGKAFGQIAPVSITVCRAKNIGFIIGLTFKPELIDGCAVAGSAIL
jgi:hypothetical protein